MDATVVIPTIGRLTLKQTIESALREGFPVIVVCDGACPAVVSSIQQDQRVHIVQLGKAFGWYGAIAYNVGAYMAKTEFIISLADDDELGFGFGSILSKTLKINPKIDIWIPQLICNDGHRVCHPELGCIPGNIGAPIYRVDVLANVPFKINVDDIHGMDYHHVAECVQKGFLLDWQPELKYLIRPQLPNTRGFGMNHQWEFMVSLKKRLL